MSKLPARLVYSPQAHVYTKDQNGTVYNLTPYVTAGQVQRKVNQVSTAEITLRNPYKYFTGGQGQPRIFHPMDPITIYLERLQGFPVRVFTGYLDTAPYYQLYPGTVTLTASCTLKKLLYTYFDPALPYVMSFFVKYGWIPTGTGTIISSQTLGKSTSQADVDAGKKPFTALQDASLAKLLWATLFDIGEWQDTNIFIEELPNGPDGIAARMQALMKAMHEDEATASDKFTTFMNDIIGSGSQGGASTSATAGNPGSTGNVTDIAKIVPTMAEIANSFSLPPLFVISVWLAEGQITDNSPNSSNARGYFQFTSSTPYPGITVNYPQDASDLGIATSAFCKAALATAKNGRSNVSGSIPANFNMNDQSQWETWAETVQNPGRGAYASYWTSKVQQAQQLISKYGNGTPVTGSLTKTVASVVGAVGSSGVGTALSGGAKGNSNGVINPIPGFSGFSFDKGIDCSAPVGSAILAPAACTLVNHQDNFYSGQPLMLFKFDNPIPNAPTQYWFVSEQINPVTLTHGTHFNQGDTVAKFAASGTAVEIGWGDPNTNDMRYAPVEAHYGQAHTGWGWNFYNYFSVGSGSPQQAGAPPTTGGGSATGGATTTQTTAQAFVAELQFPSAEDRVVAVALGTEHRGLMHDQSLMPFVQQIAQASLRSFQSLPNGDFYAFYPDYFGEMGHHKPYWYIHDIEILDGGVNLSDDALATHVFAVGDNMLMGTSIVGNDSNSELMNMLFSSASINIFNAFLAKGLVDVQAGTSKTKSKTKDGNMDNLMSQDEAIKFIQRYGARPLVKEYPMVRSSIFEMLLAYQQFLLAWSNQFKTPFTFTFMPEIFPGGKVGFPEHGLQMYVDSVTHQWDYAAGGFTTTTELSAPAVLDGVNPADFPDIPPFMVQAMVEPIKQKATKHTSKHHPQTTQQAAQSVSNIVDQTVQQVTDSVANILGVTNNTFSPLGSAPF